MDCLYIAKEAMNTMTTMIGTMIATTNVVLLLLSSDVGGGFGGVGDDVGAATSLPPIETTSYGCVRTCTLEIKASSSLNKRMSLIGSVVVTVTSK